MFFLGGRHFITIKNRKRCNYELQASKDFQKLLTDCIHQATLDPLLLQLALMADGNKNSAEFADHSQRYSLDDVDLVDFAAVSMRVPCSAGSVESHSASQTTIALTAAQ